MAEDKGGDRAHSVGAATLGGEMRREYGTAETFIARDAALGSPWEGSAGAAAL